MMIHDTETRAVTLVDIPLLMRLIVKATVLDNEFEYTRAVGVPNGARLSDALLQRGFHTLVTRSERQQVIGQFRLRPETPNAQIVYLTPYLENDFEDDTIWLHMLDAMAREAGKHEARALVAEVDEDSELFETLRAAGYAVYARQQIWRWRADDLPVSPQVDLKEATEEDVPGIQSLFAQMVPPLLQQITGLPSDSNGWVYSPNGQTRAYIAASSGKDGVYAIPYLHPDSVNEASAVFNSFLRRLRTANKRPVYVCVRRHQDWIIAALEKVRFVPGSRQAVMVKHLAAGVHPTRFESVRERVRTVTVPEPPANSTVADVLESSGQRTP